MGRDLVLLEVWMTSRQTMMAWGDPHLLLRQLQAFLTAIINGIISAKRREVRASPWGNVSSLISQACRVSIYFWMGREYVAKTD